jgi:hypothetical protein
MKPDFTTPPRRMSGMLALGAAALLVLTAASAARAGEIIPVLSVVGGSGVPGSTVAVTVALSDDIENLAASADVDLVFPADQLTFFPPVTMSCEVDPRLAASHLVGGQLDGDDVVILSIFPNPAVFPIVHLGNGPLASCDFRIQLGIPAGTAIIEIQNEALFDDMGDPLDVNAVDGFVRILETQPPTPTSTPVTPPTNTATATRTATATVTNTGVDGGTRTNTPVATPTNTPVGGTPTNTPVATPTNTPATGTPTNTPVIPTATRTGGGGSPTATGGTISFAEDDGCNIAATERSSSGGMLALLLAPALLVWARRRRF